MATPSVNIECHSQGQAAVNPLRDEPDGADYDYDQDGEHSLLIPSEFRMLRLSNCLGMKLCALCGAHCVV